METSSRESDEKVERIQRKLDEAILQQQKDKKTNEETLDAFQADIDALEKEKQDLKVGYVEYLMSYNFPSREFRFPFQSFTEFLRDPWQKSQPKPSYCIYLLPSN